jgi:hypothetical protein
VSIADDLRKADRELKKILADVGGANTPEMRAAARVLVKSIKKQISHQGDPSRSFDSRAIRPADRRAGHGSRSAPKIVGGVVRVGTGRFTLRILQDGVVGHCAWRAGHTSP